MFNLYFSAEKGEICRLLSLTILIRGVDMSPKFQMSKKVV